MLFYIFFEAGLIPMFLVIGIWGGKDKIYAAFKFFLYTLIGSLLMLVAVVYMYHRRPEARTLRSWKSMHSIRAFKHGSGWHL